MTTTHPKTETRRVEAAMDAFYPGEDWRTVLGEYADGCREEMRAALAAADAIRPAESAGQASGEATLSLEQMVHNVAATAYNEAVALADGGNDFEKGLAEKARGQLLAALATPAANQTRGVNEEALASAQAFLERAASIAKHEASAIFKEHSDPSHEGWQHLTRDLASALSSPHALHVVFDGPPGPQAGRFVEVETPDGKSVDVGQWHARADGLWELRLATPATAPGEREALKPFAAAGDSLTEFPPAGLVSGNLYVACKNPGLGTGWHYMAVNALVSDLHAASAALRTNPPAEAPAPENRQTFIPGHLDSLYASGLTPSGVLRAEAPAPAGGERDALARFGHHPDPANDFCVEVEVIQGMAHDESVGVPVAGDLSERIARAMTFRAGGDEIAVSAKGILRKIESDRAALASPSVSPPGDRQTVEVPDEKGQRRMAEGCCSAISPCSHQRSDPYTLCGICAKAVPSSDWKLQA
ncbi:hypothetical protein G3T14_18115 [Methylobacterium sp. BTF04]|uniref:hypothetical protein n=1 Tax=Methylobacterium sp. BTF04 TaxID=2708300 RepID=UPI0013D5BBC4|nr:hypothetical protein [Methylobacterium sp. BTF04]NEU14030.1 hypothetical protein [Methylobacterium sp. BTF04]